MEGINRVQNYQIVKPVGSGGMSTVYMAVDDKLKRTVALKMLHPHLCNEPLAVERFRREALSAAKLDHPNIVRIYDYLIENNVHCIVMEYVPGLDIETIVKRKGGLEFKTAQYVMHKVAVALKAAHQQGLMHRDVKPSNILLHEDGRVMLSDFGLVKHSMDTSLTVDNAVAGTPAFMSPEQMSGKKVNYSSDIYSWAVTFYHLLSGALPYQAKEFAEIVYAIQGGKIHLDKTAIAAVPPKYVDLITRCLLLNPEERLQTGADLLKALSAAPPPEEMDLVKLFELPRTASSDYLTEQISRTRVFKAAWLSRKRAKAALAILGLAFIAYLGFVFFLRKEAPVPRPAREILPAASAHPDTSARPKMQDAPSAARTMTDNVSRNVILKKNSPAAPPAPVPEAAAAAVIPDTGRLFVACEPWANVSIDGKDYGQTPLPILSLAAGRHFLRLTNPYSDSREDSLTIAANTVLRKHYKLNVKPAYSQPPAVK